MEWQRIWSQSVLKWSPILEKLLKLSQAARLTAHKAVNGRYQTKMVSSQSPNFPKIVYYLSILESYLKHLFV